MERLIIEACVGFSNTINLCYREHDRRMKFLRKRFISRLKSKIESNFRIHQLNLMNTIDMLLRIEVNKNNLKDFNKVRITNIGDLDNIRNILEKNRIKNKDRPIVPRPKRIRKRKGTKKRSVWMNQRSAEWWNKIKESGDDELMLEHLHIDRETYKYLCETLDDKLKPSINMVRESLTTETKVAVAIYKLVSNEVYTSVGAKFGVHSTSVRNCIYQFCEACFDTLLKEHVYMPVSEEIYEVMQEFEDKNGLPQVLGAIEGTPLSLSPHSLGYRKLIMSKGSSQLVLQAVIDANFLFRDIAFLYDTTDFVEYNMNIKKIMLGMPKKELDDCSIPAYLVSSRLDPVQPWIMKPYEDVITPEEESFNDSLSEASQVAAETFIRLKGRWKILKEPMAVNTSSVSKIIGTCCILHNILEKKGVYFNESWSSDLTDKDIIYTGHAGLFVGKTKQGETARDNLKNYMSLLIGQ